ncbi:hypothetical protein TH25_21235 [Thalassospira profundimaris]|uniref:Uncharacterized protein n=1 Tax=Thalassospira profundimaris TaxID=502049 RepID=A0A367WQE1_9PROT|nr:hypothetical protein [Thalassospira profundimaris]RCK43674.1 hypothetical protein TH25_21235 [Thalassospira profundimaris]
MKRKIVLEVYASDYEIRAAKACAKRNGEKSLNAMLKNFVETEMRNYAFDDLQHHTKAARR